MTASERIRAARENNKSALGGALPQTPRETRKTMTLGTTIHDEVVEMSRVRGSSWKLTLDGQQHGRVQSFVACVIVAHRLVPVHRRVIQ